MNLSVVRKELREARWKLVAGTLALSAMALAIPLTFGIVSDLIGMMPAEQLQKYGRLFPPEEAFSNYAVYIWSQWNAKNLLQFGVLLAILTGMTPIAGEISGHTAGFLLTRPVSRRFVYLSKVFAGIVILTLAVSLSTLVLVTAVNFADSTLQAGRLFGATLITLVGIIVFYSLTLFLSTLIDEPVKAGALALLAALGFSALGWLPSARLLSPFAHMQGAQYFLTGSFPFLPVAAMILSAMALLACGSLIFDRREI